MSADLIPSSFMQPAPEKPVVFYHYNHQDVIPWQGIYISLADAQTLLAMQSRIESMAHRLLHSFDDDELHELWRELTTFISDINKKGHGDSPTYALLVCLQQRCSDKIAKRKKARARDNSEQQMYATFRKNPSRYIPGVKIRTDIKAGMSRPDFFLDVDGVFAVAEFKYGNFRARHLYQLQEYMHRFNAPRGYAVAQTLKCSLPEDVTYVRMF